MHITLNQLDALQELVNVGVEQSVVVLNEILKSQTRLQVSQVEILSLRQANQTLQRRIGLVHVSVLRLPFTGIVGGDALLVFPTDSAAKLITVLMQEETDLPDLNPVKRGMFSEVSNIILNSVMAEVSKTLKQSLRYTIPFYVEDNINDLLPSLNPEAGTTILLAQARLTCNLLQFTGNIVLAFTVRSFNTLLLKLDIVQD